MARVRNMVEASSEDQFSADLISADAPLDEAAELAAIEAALNGETDAEIEIEDATFEEVNEEELMNALEADEAKERAYETAESEIETAADDESEKPVEKKKAARTPGGQAAIRDADAFASAAIAAFGGDSLILDSEEGALTEEQFRERLAEVKQIKVREKVLNLLNAAMNGRTPTKYTQIAGDLLVKASLNGENLTIAEIKKAYEDNGYKPGTVNAQAGQMMALFPALGMAKRGGRAGRSGAEPEQPAAGHPRLQLSARM